MKTFEIEITETLSRVIHVKAVNQNDAISIVEDMYRKEQIVLDYSDFLKVAFYDKNKQSV